MNWDHTSAQEAILDFLREPIVPVKDDNDNLLLTLEQAAIHLGISKKKLADISGNSKRGGRILKIKIGRQPYYQREELNRYLDKPMLCGHPRSAIQGNGITHWCHLCEKGAK